MKYLSTFEAGLERAEPTREYKRALYGFPYNRQRERSDPILSTGKNVFTEVIAFKRGYEE